MMNNSSSTKIRLLCVVIDDNLKVHDSSFVIAVPFDGDFGGVIGCVIEVTPSLKGVDHGKFRLYKPPLDRSIRISDSLDGLQLTQEHLTIPLLVPYKVNEFFRVKDTHLRFDVDVIVRANFGEPGTFLHLLIDKPSV